MTTYELRLFFGTKGQAITTVVAESYEAALAIAYKKYSHKRITKAEVVEPRLKMKLG